MKKLFSKILLLVIILSPFILVAQTTHLVNVGPGMVYTPSELTIEEGDIVTWISLGGYHDVNFDINSITGESFGNPAEIADASLPVQSSPGEMGSITFESAGTYNYDCSVGSHAEMGMIGAITVTPAAQTTHIVNVGPGMVYTPSELTIEEGDIVTWISLGGYHDVNFDINTITGESFGNPPEIADASLPVQSGAGEMGSITFESAGTYNYDCSVGSHAEMGMIGAITVTPAAGFYPPLGSTFNSDSSEVTLPNASQNTEYNESISFYATEEITMNVGDSDITLGFISAEILSVSAPDGMTVTCDPSDCVFGPNAWGEVNLSGTALEYGEYELDLSAMVTVNLSSLGINSDITFPIPYNGEIPLLNVALGGTDYSALNSFVPTFILNVEPDAQNSSLISDCDDFTSGPDAWPYVLVATTIADGAASQESQTYTMNVTSLPEDGANFRVYKTTANGNDFFGTPVELSIGLNTITVDAVTFDRAVKFQFSSGDVEFDALSLNGDDSDCVGTLPPPISSLISDCDDFTSGPDAWPYVLVATTIADGAASQESQTYTMNVTSLPEDGANFRVYKTTANGNDFFGTPVELSIGLNTITVDAVTFDRAVKFQFSSGDVEFDALSLNGDDSDCVGTLSDISPDEQVLDLTIGWSMFSTYMMADDMAMDAVLDPIIAQVIIAKNYIGDAYLPEFGFNGIGDILIGEGYQIKTSEAVGLTISGNYMTPEDNSIELVPGWNMIGYLRLEPAAADLALGGLVDAGNLIIAKDYLGAAFLPEFGFNGIGDLMPGSGYQIKTNTVGTLTYLSNEESYRFSALEVTHNDVKHYTNPLNTGSNMHIVISDEAWEATPQIGDELSAYNSKGEIVGSAIYSSPITVLTVWGDDATTHKIDGLIYNEALSFKLWTKHNNSSQEMIVKEWIEGVNAYQIDALYYIGAIEPSNNLTNRIHFGLYPIPAKQKLNIDIELSTSENISISIFNLIGELVSTYTKNLTKGLNNVQLDIATLNEGAYLIKINSNDGVIAKKFNVIK